MFCLTLICFSQFLAPPLIEHPIINFVNGIDLKSVIFKLKKVALCVIKDYDHNQRNTELENLFSAAFMLHIATPLAFIKSESYFGDQKHRNIPNPLLIILESGFEVTRLAIPQDQNVLLKQLEALTCEKNEVVSDVKDLPLFLSNLNYTLISQYTDSEQYKSLLYQITEEYGPCDLLFASSNVMDEIAGSNYDFAVYRNSDGVIVPLDKHLSNFPYAFAKNNNVFSESDIMDSDNLTIGIVSKKIDQKIPLGIIFEKLFKDFPDQKIGIITNSTIPFVESFSDHDFNDYLDLVIFNYKQNIYYPTKRIVGVKYGEEWISCAVSIIKEVLKGNKQPEFKSEIIPTRQYFPYINKIVGHNYEEFINNNSTDFKFIVYLKEESEELLDLISNVATKIRANITSMIDFAYIDITKNFVKKLPKLINITNIYIYSNEDNLTYPLLERPSEESLYRFINQYIPALGLNCEKMFQDDAISLIQFYTDNLDGLEIKEKLFIVDYLMSLSNALPSMRVANREQVDESIPDGKRMNLSGHLQP
ncbi:hypothetical protein TVAG_494330 [Trichomonas vaginalis G3]|uniref:Solute-binding protein family 3/N-terminal domain-containing protein n=1 Tax=Trichomonas vaginalis (strain ATCC PRA-98 / G3) TaxID=412133 RepID=A2DQ64_TRIV3|nr:thioredoxin-like family [Trichomonas vaginalis G3]EAY17491.1 hypothetical protein TVAG_494330 [Trichomonas vaginalis G3]KAI5533597.1 thioredoxin-like family [Trichomonas vaginalis G3]|eukprot:XP_001329626.1 hypothetical protein [Trichomonas vaginalis G3]